MTLSNNRYIFNLLNIHRDDDSRPGADDFLPVFIYVVLKAAVPFLHSNITFISNYGNPMDLNSRAGYCFTNLAR